MTAAHRAVSVALAATTAITALFAGSAVASASTRTASTPASQAATVGLKNSDLSAGFTVKAESGGTSLKEPTLNNCGYVYSSESHRVARRTVDVLDKKKVLTGITNEVAVYDSATWASRAMNEWRTSVATCSPGRYVASSPQDPTMIATTVLSNTTNKALPVKNNSVTVSRLTLQETQETLFFILVIQQQGNVLSATYALTDTKPAPQLVTIVAQYAYLSGRHMTNTGTTT